MAKLGKMPPIVLAGVFMVFGIISLWFFLFVAGGILPGDWDVVNSKLLIFAPYLIAFAFALIALGLVLESK